MNPAPLFRIGNQSSFAAARMLEPFEFALASGFDAFEFFPDRGFGGQGGWDERGVDRATRQDIRRAASGGVVALTVHAPLEFDPLREPESDRLYSTVEFASELGAKLLNLHLDVSLGVDRFVTAIGPALRATAETGLQLTFENTVLTSPDDFNWFFAALRHRPELPVAHVGMCFDLGHANLCAATHNDYWRFLDQLSEQVPIRHLHLHENYGDRDSHLTLFTGPSGADPRGIEGVIERLARRGFSGCAILEQWPRPPSLLTAARDRLLPLIKSCS